MDYTLKALKSFSGLEFSYSPESSQITIHKGDVSKEEIFVKAQKLQAAEPMRLLRQQRDQKLALTDWMAVSDRTMTPAQIDFRQSLRDMPANNPDVALNDAGELINVTWPTEPSS